MSGPVAHVQAWARNAWRALTSMGTALVLLFVSLVGCLTPRMIEHARSLRATPVAAPRNLARLPKHAGAELLADPEELNALANTITGRLRGWRTAIRHPDDNDASAVPIDVRARQVLRAFETSPAVTFAIKSAASRRTRTRRAARRRSRSTPR